MKKIDFDDYANNYTAILNQQLRFFDGDVDYFAEYKIILSKAFFSTQPQRILDFGCGIGRSTAYLQKHYPKATVYGCDISEKSLAAAKQQFPTLHFQSLAEIMQQQQAFDFIFLAGVLHHVPVAERPATVNILRQLAQLNATLLIFEHNPLNPVTRYLVNTCPFDEDAVLLWPRETQRLLSVAGMRDQQCHYTLFFPASLKWLRPAERYLRWLPLGGQYVVKAIC